MKCLSRFLSKIITLVVTAVLILPTCGFADNLPQPGGDIGDYGTWATPNNIANINNSLSEDINNMLNSFERHQLADNYVPIEAKLGLTFMNAMSWLSGVLDRSLIPFIITFIIIAYGFWIMMEAYNMMTTTSDVKKFATEAVKKGALIVIWMAVLNLGITQLFMYVMGPILNIGTIFSDLILDSVTAVAGVSLPDTCGQIRAYAAANATTNALMNPEMAANIMCLPTRMSGLFVSAVGVGFKWMLAGIGSSMLTFLAGALFVVIFAISIWKFALMALGVIADLFLAVMMLPFTALAETLNKTSYKGIAGNIYNGFLALFKVDSLSAQIQRFINATIYFVALSVVVSMCAALLSPIITPNIAAQVPSMDNTSFMVALMTGCLVLYLANKAGDLAKQFGGSINDSVGQQMGKDAVGLTKGTWKTGKGWYKAWRGKK